MREQLEKENGIQTQLEKQQLEVGKCFRRFSLSCIIPTCVCVWGGGGSEILN